MNNFKDYLNEEKNKNNQSVNEASLSRVYQHFNSGRPIGLITAFRGGEEGSDEKFNRKENIERNKELAQATRDAGYGYIWVDGSFIENQGTDKERKVSEDSLLIIGPEKDKDGVNKKMFDFLIQQSKKYDQDAFVFKEHGSTDVALYDKKGNVITELKNARFDRTAEIFTGLRHGSHAGRSFVLENATPSQGFGSALYNKYKKD